MRLIRDISGALPIKMIIIAVLVIAIGGGAFTVLKAKKGTKAEKEPVKLSSWKLEEFVVNLVDRDEPRYLKVDMTLEVEGREESEGGGEGEAAESPEEAKVRDTIITVLTRKSYTEMLAKDGKERLKAELKTELNKTLENIKVHDIYFTSFAMQ